MTPSDIPEVMRIIRQEALRFKTPYVAEVSGRGASRDPFKVLLSCIISLRTKDEVTRASSERLFDMASTPEEVSSLGEAAIRKAIYPAGFYRVKARVIRDMARRIATEHGGAVPDTIEGLLGFKGVGRKTANLVVTMGFGGPGICVDAHVHRITNRWGLVSTRTPDETETSLRGVLARRYWIPFNDLLVKFGRNVCRPISPFCSICRLRGFCSMAGVERHR
jgi:endonuclease-3